jgi:hypothetical protein
MGEMQSVRMVRGVAGPAALKAALDQLGVKDGDEFFIAVNVVPTEAHTRTGDPATSRQAAASINDLRESQRAVLKVFERTHNPMTDETLIAVYTRLAPEMNLPTQSESGLRSRRAELVEGGLLRDTGEKAQISTGRNAVLWGLPTPAADTKVEVVAEPGLLDVPEETRPQHMYDPTGDFA